MKFLRNFLCAGLSWTLPAAAIDLDSNGMCDVWQARFHATGLDPNGDEDGDGATNREESIAGTDPLDPGSVFRAAISEIGAENVKLEFPQAAGKSYRILVSPTLVGTWTPHSNPVPLPGTAGFFRVEVTDQDSDGDGVSDWAELQLAGFDPAMADSFGHPGGDLAVATEMLQALASGAVDATVNAAAAYEKNLAPAVVTWTRSTGTGYPFTLFLKTSGASDPTKSSASPADFSLADAAGNSLTHQLVIPAGANSAELRILPVADDLPEVPEELVIRLGGSSRMAAVSIRDAEPVAANQRLFVAYLRPRPGTGSLGSGVATVLLAGDNDTGTIGVSFSNLNSPVNSTQVQTVDSAILQSVPPFAYGGQSWPIRASQAYITDQAVLDALLGGDVELSVFTEAHVAGEIAGTFGAASGSTEFQEPPPPPALASLSGAELDREIVRFLTQTTFGPTMDEIDSMRERIANHDGDRLAAYGEWIDEQLALPTPSLLAYTMAGDALELQTGHTIDPNERNKRHGWWLFARHAPCQLRQRAAFALSQIFVISDADSVVRGRAYGAAHYYDMLTAGASGDFRDLLEDVSTHPMMGHYLSHLRNGKATLDGMGNVVISPDENFAREVMQLFSIGLVQLHPDGSLKLGPDGLPLATYQQDDITAMARVFTGWSFSKRNSPSASDTVIDNQSFTHGNGTKRYESQWTHPMKVFPSQHDTAQKDLLGITLPAGQTGEEDLAQILDHLATHPNTAPFISRRLIQRFVTANPSAGYLYRVSNAFTASGGNFPATIKAILLDPEARALENSTTITSIGKSSEPIVRYLAFIRAFGATSALPLTDLETYGYPSGETAIFPAGTTRMRVGNTTTSLSQTPQFAPSVFNWFLPDYTPAGLLAANGLVSPELQLANENSVYSIINYHYNIIYSSSGQSGDSLIDTPSNSDHLFLDLASLEALYMGIVDVNGDGQFDGLDIGTFNNPVKIREACEAVLDHIDLMICAGTLKSEYGETPGKPRRIILDALAAIRASSNGSNNAANQQSYMRDRIKAALWLVVTTPDTTVQK